MLKQRAQTTEPKLEHHKELPLHICNLPLSQSTLPLNQCSNATRECNKDKTLLTLPGRLDRLPKAVRPPTTQLTAGVAVTPPHVTSPAPNCSKFARTNWNTFQTLPGAQNRHKRLPLVYNAWIKEKCEKFQHIASQIYKNDHKELHKSKWAS
jgi:hypothetical protein